MAKGGGGVVTGHGGRCKHTERGAEMSGRGWRVEGVDDVQVDIISRQERREAWMQEIGDTTTNASGGGGGG